MGSLPMEIRHEQHYQDQHLDLDFGQKVVRLDAKPLGLTRKEYELLALLIQNAGEVVRRETLLLTVWGYNNQIRTRTLDVHIRRLRKKMGQHSGVYIETIFGIGYRFQPFRAPKVVQTLSPAMALGA
jgi:DNA-binding response OmpR family regulator